MHAKTQRVDNSSRAVTLSSLDRKNTEDDDGDGDGDDEVSDDDNFWNPSQSFNFPAWITFFG